MQLVLYFHDPVPSPLVIRADDLARAMVEVVVREKGERGGLVFENCDIRAMVGSLHHTVG